MGRPWWYESYRDKDEDREPRKKRFQIPLSPQLIWGAVFLVSALFTISNDSFHFSFLYWMLGFVYYLCRVLTLMIFLQALLTWFPNIRSDILVFVISTVSDPILRPLRRIVPRFRIYDLAPLVAVGIFYIVPLIISVLLF